MLVEAEIWTLARTNQGNAVLIRPIGSETVVPIFIGKLEAQSILIGLENVPMPRPMTHDLFLNVLETMHLTLKRIEITDLKQGTYIARILMEGNGTELELDSRPSDALALAVRIDSPIFIDESVVDAAGIDINEVGQEKEINPLVEQREDLLKMLQESVEEERYEDSARIRDQLRDIERQMGLDKPDS